MNRDEAEALAKERRTHRRAKNFAEADAIRERLREGGWDVVDSHNGSEVQALKAPASTAPAAAPRAVTLLTVVHGWKPDAERWLLSVFTHCKADFEALIIDNSGDERIAGWLHSRAAERFRSIKLDPPLGFAGAVNAGIGAGSGPFGLGGNAALKEFAESPGPEVDAIEGYCMAFRRADALALEGFDPKFRFSRIAGIRL